MYGDPASKILLDAANLIDERGIAIGEAHDYKDRVCTSYAIDLAAAKAHNYRAGDDAVARVKILTHNSHIPSWNDQFMHKIFRPLAKRRAIKLLREAANR